MPDDRAQPAQGLGPCDDDPNVAASRAARVFLTVARASYCRDPSSLYSRASRVSPLSPPEESLA
jgi:hypothetical protein